MLARLARTGVRARVGARQMSRNHVTEDGRTSLKTFLTSPNTSMGPSHGIMARTVQDKGVYPLIIIMAGAVVLVGAMGRRYLGNSPEVQ